MKKFCTILLILFSFVGGSFAENIKGMTTDCMVWDVYSQEWESIGNGSGIPVTVTDKYLYISSNDEQRFYLYNVSETYTNKSGHEQFTADAYDKNNVRCGLRFVFRNDIEAPLQIYIHYNNIDYVYNVLLF